MKAAYKVCILMMLMHKSVTPVSTLPAYFSTPFRQAQARSVVETDPQWQLVEHLYKELTHQTAISCTVHIPKIIHQIWLGSPLPDRYIRLQKTLKDKHPDWEYRLWTDADVENLKLENCIAYNASNNYGEKSDIARYEILYRFGGLYADLDVECIDSFDVLHHMCDFYAGISPLSNTVILENCIIGCSPGHPIMKECVTTLMRKEVPGSYLHDITQCTGPGHLTKCFFNRMEESSKNNLISVALPSFFFFSPDLFRKKDIKKMPFMALHYWEGSWQQPEHRWHNKGWENYSTRFQ